MSSLLANSIGKLSIRSVNCLRSTALSTSTNWCAKQTIYQNFVRLKFAEIKQQHPSLTSAEVMRKLGETYRQLTPEQKAQFQVPAAETPDPEAVESAWAEKRKRLRYAHRHGMPRRPPASGFNVFIREQLSDLKGVPLSKVTLRLRDAVKDWSSLSPAEQKTYGLKAQELKNQYEKDLQHWAAEHDLRFTKNLSVLTQRFYERDRARVARPQTNKSDIKSGSSKGKHLDRASPSDLTAVAAAAANVSHARSSHGSRSKSPPRSP